MHGSDRVPDLNIDYERALVGRAKATASTRAKWHSPTSACCSVLEKGLTPPTLSETRFFANNPKILPHSRIFSHQCVGRTKSARVPGIGCCVAVPQLFCATMPVCDTWVTE